MANMAVQVTFNVVLQGRPVLLILYDALGYALKVSGYTDSSSREQVCWLKIRAVPASSSRAFFAADIGAGFRALAVRANYCRERPNWRDYGVE